MKYIIALIGLCFIAPASIELGVVDISFQTLVILVIGAYFTSRDSFLLVLGYILFGVIGLPVYSGYVGGYEKLLGPTAGFFVGFIVSAPVVGFLRRRMAKSFLIDSLILMASHVVILIPGFVWLGIKLPDLNLFEILWPLLPGLFIKSLIGAGIVFFLEKNPIHLKA